MAKSCKHIICTGIEMGELAEGEETLVAGEGPGVGAGAADGCGVAVAQLQEVFGVVVGGELGVVEQGMFFHRENRYNLL